MPLHGHRVAKGSTKPTTIVGNLWQLRGFDHRTNLIAYSCKQHFSPLSVTFRPYLLSDFIASTVLPRTTSSLPRVAPSPPAKTHQPSTYLLISLPNQFWHTLKRLWCSLTHKDLSLTTFEVPLQFVCQPLTNFNLLCPSRSHTVGNYLLL